ncbi:3'(2'),5'-bisphosphate nucleotidase CysQ [Sphingosinicella sp. CPCC 101087]|uniref:3'(2'),5'-bisphosphate nucleotidase CysQ n=1 Tax=Sphingosinicella sp. CPCC 101087 TaxID=2497754 RepID=UPI00101C1A7A|nr:3'(2'),5'-bisphosphate nucleotidase CysQ [Sphingosinicella sp. CPCC 101087]
MTDEELAARLAEGAGRLLTELRESRILEGAALGRVGDKVANAYLLTALREWRPQDAILSEESPDDKARLEKERVWIIDPLDGTREFSEGRDDWAVHVALAVRGEPRLGAVSLPARARLFRSDCCPTPPGGQRPRPLMLVSRTRPPAEVEDIAAMLGAELAPMGSAGAKAAAVIAGDADIYYHAGGQHEWDNCAPAAVAIGAGLHASRVDGSPLLYNRPDTIVPDLVIARPEWAEKIVAYCRK